MKVPKPRKLKSGVWFIQLRLGGDSYSITKTTEKDCIKEAQYIKAQHLAGKVGNKNPVENMTLSQAIDKYIESRENSLSPSTVDGYRRIQKNRFKAVMGLKLKDIADWQTICDRESKNCGAKTLKNAYGFIVSVLSFSGITPPRVTLPQTISNQRKWLEPEEIIRLIPTVVGTDAALPVLLALHSLRRSEMLALDMGKNIDLDNGIIKIQGAVVPNEKHKFVEKRTNKNSTSARNIKIVIPELLTELKALDRKEGKVITCSPHTVCNRINRACRQAGLPEVGTHGMRHSFASLAYHLGMSEMETMEIGGWADASTMRKIYTHLAQKDRLKAENKMEAFYKNNLNTIEKNANENANDR